MKKVAINGLGRIGRLVLRHLMKVPHVRVVAVNDLTDAHTLAHLMKYDSVHGPADFPVASDGNYLVLDGRRIRVYAEKDPQLIPFGAQGAQVVLECTGKFTKRDRAALHLQGSVSHVIISAPSDDADRTVVMGVNETTLVPATEHVISNASCTTNCLGPVVKVMDDTFGIDYGFMTTVHSYTNDQRLLDLPHKDLRRARAAFKSIIPTTSSAFGALHRAMPGLPRAFDGVALRVPTLNVNLVDLVATLRRDADATSVNAAYEAAAAGPWRNLVGLAHPHAVSCDITGRPESVLMDLDLTMMLGPRFVKVFGWHDNETGYAARLCDLVVELAGRI